MRHIIGFVLYLDIKREPESNFFWPIPALKSKVMVDGKFLLL